MSDLMMTGEKKQMNVKKSQDRGARSKLTRTLLLGLLGAVAIFSTVPSASAAVGPAFASYTTWGDTNLQPGGEGQFVIHMHNVGDQNANGAMTITAEVPEFVTINEVFWSTSRFVSTLGNQFCAIEGTRTLKCVIPAEPSETIALLGLEAPGPFGGLLSPNPAGWMPPIYIGVSIDPQASGISPFDLEVEGGGDPTPLHEVIDVPFGSSPASFDIAPGAFEADTFEDAVPGGTLSRQAGDHPFELRVNFEFTKRTGIDPGDGTRYTVPSGAIKDVEVTTPRGLIGNPEALPKCDPAKFAEIGVVLSSTKCPSDTQVGYLNIHVTNTTSNRGRGAIFFSGAPDRGLSRVPLYNMKPPKGAPADFAFNAGSLVQGHIYPNLDPGQNYAVKTLTPNISSFVQPTGAEVSIWGVPGDPVHDKFRYFTGLPGTSPALGAPFDASIQPLLTNPSDCGFDNGGNRIRISSYQHPEQFSPVQEYANPLNVTGCDDQRVRFKPEIALQPTSKAAGGPTGLAVSLKIPQRNEEVADAEELYARNGSVKGISTPPMKKAVVTFPPGMTVNPSAAQGLTGCAPDQIGVGTDAPVTCPDSSQFGTLKLETPILPINEQPEGWIYVAKPYDNPFHTFLSLYLVIQEPDRGVLVKLAGRADLDPNTGQITFTFDDLPQLPLAEATMSIKSGLRSGLVNPGTCGVKTIQADFYSWSDPTVPKHVESSYEVTQNPNGSPCYQSLSDRPFNPILFGGTHNNAAGAYSPTEIRFTRTDEDQELGRVEGTGPPGLLASIRGVGRCSDAAIASAGNPERTGTEELEHPSCPSDSLVGTVDAGSGTGQVLTYVPGKIYLAGPYKGAPLSGVAIVPAVAGPFDLGVVVTRAPAFINPQTAELTVKTDPLPQIFKGVPIRVRDIQVHLDRNHFTLNPTNCDPFALTGDMFSTEGKEKNGGSRFQAADCASLGYKPKLTTRLFGGTTRGSHPKFRGIFKGREGDANTKSVVVTMPRSEFLDQSHIRTVCTRVQFAAGGGNGEQCPAGSVYGHVTARSPLVEETLQGPVFLRSSNHKLPDLVAELHGIVDVEVDGRIDSIKGGIRASFESVPDVPVENFTITMQGGKKGLLINSRNTCAHKYAATAELDAQSGKETTLRPKLQFHCGAKGHKHKHKHKSHSHK